MYVISHSDLKFTSPRDQDCSVDFIDMSKGTMRGEAVAFERLSTLPYDPCKQTEQQQFHTQWIWYWENEDFRWQEFKVCCFVIVVVAFYFLNNYFLIFY